MRWLLHVEKVEKVDIDIVRFVTAFTVIALLMC